MCTHGQKTAPEGLNLKITLRKKLSYNVSSGAFNRMITSAWWAAAERPEAGWQEGSLIMPAEHDWGQRRAIDLQPADWHQLLWSAAAFFPLLHSEVSRWRYSVTCWWKLQKTPKGEIFFFCFCKTKTDSIVLALACKERSPLPPPPRGG